MVVYGILNSLGIINYLSFGIETDNIDILNQISKILVDEPTDYKIILNNELNKGTSFPKARQNSILQYTNNPELASALSKPNNILAIDYLKALNKLNSNINPFSIKRAFTEHNSNIPNNSFASASFIRGLLNTSNINKLKNFVPEASYTILKECYDKGHIINGLKYFEKEIIFTLRTLSIEELSNLPEVTEGLEYAIKKAADSTNDLDILISMIKSKRYTYTRIQRILLYALLKITKNDMNFSKNINNSYIRVLCANEKGKELLSEISRKSILPIITSVKKSTSRNKSQKENASHNCEAQTNYSNNRLLNIDIKSTNIYTLAYKTESNSNLDFTHPVFYYD